MTWEYDESEFARLRILYTQTRFPIRTIVQLMNVNSHRRQSNGQLEFPFTKDILKDMMRRRPIDGFFPRDWPEEVVARFCIEYRQIDPSSRVPWQQQVLNGIVGAHNLTFDTLTDLLRCLWRAGDIRLLHGENMGPDVRDMSTWPKQWVHEFMYKFHHGEETMATARCMKRDMKKLCYWATDGRLAAMAQFMTILFYPYKWDIAAIEKAVLACEKPRTKEAEAEWAKKWGLPEGGRDRRLEAWTEPLFNTRDRL